MPKVFSWFSQRKRKTLADDWKLDYYLDWVALLILFSFSYKKPEVKIIISKKAIRNSWKAEDLSTWMSYDSWETLKFQHESLNDGITYQLDRNMLATTSVGSIKKNKSSAQVQEKDGYEKSIT